MRSKSNKGKFLTENQKGRLDENTAKKRKGIKYRYLREDDRDRIGTGKGQ